MAPHANDTIVDTSGYMPSADSVKELKKALRLHHTRSVTKKSWISGGPQTIDSHDRDGEYEACTLQLSLNDLQEIEDAVNFFERTKLPLNKLQAEHFPLPTLSAKIRRFSILLPDKQPYFIVRGLKPQWFCKYKNIIVYMGIASHVGTKRAMAAGDPVVLHHITNIPIPSEQDGTTIYRGPANRTIALPFHTDYGEILSLYTLSKAATGGDFFLADIHDIEARLRARPDILETLRKNWLMVNPKVLGGYDERPLLFTLPSGQLALQASRSRLYGTPTRPRPTWLAPLSAQQIEAVDALHVAGHEVARRFEFRSGDIIFFNNLRMMHARDSFVDGDEEENTTKRYLLRLILKDGRNDEKWELPPEMRPTWKEIYDHEDEEEIVPIHEELFSYKAGH